MKKIEKLGKIRYRDIYTFKVILDKVSNHSCEHCGHFRSKTYYFTGGSKTKIGTTWCKDCIDTFDTSEEAQMKFKKNQKVTYLNSLNESRPAKVLYYDYEDAVVCEIPNNGNPYNHTFKEDELTEV
jgi:hypothetical protein